MKKEKVVEVPTVDLQANQLTVEAAKLGGKLLDDVEAAKESAKVLSNAEAPNVKNPTDVKAANLGAKVPSDEEKQTEKVNNANLKVSLPSAEVVEV